MPSRVLDDETAEALCAEEGEAVSVENALRNTEETSQDGTEDTAYTVNGACTYRVVDVELCVNECNRDRKYYSADDADDERTCAADGVAACGDSYKSGKNTVQCQ